ncbi:MAG: CAP domain-containing protein [Candidatus Cloacimonetes bacterium]|jgi:uncharacterized protein YkwD|nr:CAP domain-containing protein [Candidatus Cloacimonadota bacterium]MCB5287482.1 CAP domain-containing protein [Candidatus Cloacimonadota bacterium]MCK9184503.1 CAP domain-containing protein [Candidatus Cloacimonadota bacterium]MCK9584315.1 CAP domain-containing protein [Candidatus Cloacimonadota bacterium]MDY0229803.1 CAP domain-containing protein [Candidatus Cloacimonadaceae bacterium]
MKRWLLILLTLALTLSALTAKGNTITIEGFEKEVWRLTNIERTRYSLRPLSYDPGLATLARYHSDNMQKRDFFAHRDHQGDEVAGRQKKYYPVMVLSNIGENIGRFRNSAGTFTPQELVSGWMNSPSHRENILHPEYTHLGVGISLQGGTMYATQDFATPLVKVKSNLSNSLSDEKIYRLKFDYLSPNKRDRLACTLIYPDPNKAYKFSDDQEMVGAQPLKLDWTSHTEFEVLVPFLAGKGNYMLCFGFDGGYYPEGLVIKVK